MPRIELKPITILVGRNSSGKSSFLRAFPLLKQSLIARSSAPILWFGELVDFANYRTTVFENHEDSSIKFHFTIRDFSYFFSEYQDIFYNTQEREIDRISECRLSYSISSFESRTVLSHIQIDCPDFDIECGIGFDSASGHVDSISIGYIDMISIFKKAYITRKTNFLSSELRHYTKLKSGDREFARESSYNESIVSSLANIIKPYLDKRIQFPRLFELALSLLQIKMFNEKNLAELANETGNRSFSRFLKRIASDKRLSDVRKQLLSHFSLKVALDIYNSASNKITNAFSDVIPKI